MLVPLLQGFGILATSHFTDGSKFDGLVIGHQNRHWFDDGHPEAYVVSKRTAQQVILGVADHARQSVHAALAEAGATPVRRRLLRASHQGTVWLREATQDYAGLSKARSVDTFCRFGSLSGANIPLVLAMGEREGLLRKGDLTVLFSGGSGETWAASALQMEHRLKEVSCRAVDLVLQRLDQIKAPLDEVVRGLPYSVDQLRNKNERIEWSRLFVQLLCNARAFWQRRRLRRDGRVKLAHSALFRSFLAFLHACCSPPRTSIAG